MTIKAKIVLLIVGFVGLTGILFGYAFPFFNAANTELTDTVITVRKELREVEAEQRNFELGKRDIATLQNKVVQPEGLFSNDTSLVREIRTLEDRAHVLGITLTITVAGSAATAPKAKTITEIKTIPFTVQAEGPFANLLQFFESIERGRFVTYIKTVSVTPATEAKVAAQLTGNFYIKK